MDIENNLKVRGKENVLEEKAVKLCIESTYTT